MNMTKEEALQKIEELKKFVEQEDEDMIEWTITNRDGAIMLKANGIIAGRLLNTGSRLQIFHNCDLVLYNDGDGKWEIIDDCAGNTRLRYKRK